ncbi:hypothetical protein DWW69_08335 [Bacteroides sp. AF16-49]|nr:hypothetical protein DXB63_02580 [Bacteroides sp. OM05-12]RHR76620.1 hypothetical protein DWW69_08335 [Bacteroides sp. AF16-49]
MVAHQLQVTEQKFQISGKSYIAREVTISYGAFTDVGEVGNLIVGYIVEQVQVLDFFIETAAYFLYVFGGDGASEVFFSLVLIDS